MASKRKINRQIIVLVEDETELLAILAQVLEAKGYEVLSASTPDDALLLLQNRQASPDLLISDMRLPGMSGSQLAANIEAVHPEIIKLFISGEPHPEKAIGNAHFLAKPFAIEELTRRVKSILKV